MASPRLPNSPREKILGARQTRCTPTGSEWTDDLLAPAFLAAPGPSSTGPSRLVRLVHTASYRRPARAIIASVSSPARARMQADGPRDNVLDEILIDHAGTFLRVEQREELNTIAEHVERPNAGEGERGAFMEMQKRVAKLRAQLEGSPGEPGRA